MVSNCLTVKLRPAWRMMGVGEVKRKSTGDSAASESYEAEGKPWCILKKVRFPRTSERSGESRCQVRLGRHTVTRTYGSMKNLVVIRNGKQWEASERGIWCDIPVEGCSYFYKQTGWVLEGRKWKQDHNSIGSDFKKQLLYLHRVDWIWLHSPFLLFSYFFFFIFFFPENFPLSYKLTLNIS